ncbi:hypothetical protein R6Z07F_009608 [Ovis aries]
MHPELRFKRMPHDAEACVAPPESSRCSPQGENAQAAMETRCSQINNKHIVLKPRPLRASCTHARTQKVKSGASPARRRRAPAPRLPAPTAARPARPERAACPARRSSFPSAHGAPRPQPPALTRAGPGRRAADPLSSRRLTPPAAPDKAFHLHTPPSTSRVLPPLARLPPCAAVAPRFHERMHLLWLHLPVSASRPPRAQETRSPPTRTGQGRRAPELLRRGPHPRPRPPPRLGSHLLAGAAGCSLRPPRAPGLVSRALAKRWSASFLSQGLRVSPPLPALPTPPHPHPPSPNSPASRRLSGVATPVFRAPGQRFSIHKTAARGSARLGAGRTIAAGGWGRGAPRPSAARRPPPARPRGPQGRSGYRLGSVTPSGAGCRRR